MHDLRFVCDNASEVQERLESRQTEVDLAPILTLNEQRKTLIQAYDTGRHEQRQLSEAFRQKDTDPAEMATARERLKTLGAELKDLETKRGEVEDTLHEKLLHLPNLPAADLPVGKGEDDNILVRTHGEIPTFAFEPKEHVELGETLGILDFAAAARISGSRFALYRGAGARLERALMNFMLNLHSEEHGYEEVLTPYLVNREAMVGTNQLPKFEEDAFQTTDGKFLIPTAEVPVTNMHREQILEGDMPIRYVAYSSCFRQEAGSYGKDTRGLTRLHQFQKVELVHFVAPEESEAALEALTQHAEEVLKRLELPYRVMTLCTGDLGFGAQKTYDIEVWLPGQNRFREISSCSNCGDFQARRASIRYRPEKGAKPAFVHTLNGSALAIGRTVMAIIENYQQSDGSIAIPAVLQPHMGGAERIQAP